MQTKIIKLANQNIKEQDLQMCKSVLKLGGLVAFPTETVYGLGADALNENASKKIYEAKGRPSDNPLIVHISDIDSVYKIATDISEKAKKLMEKFWPGPLTLIFNKKEIVPTSTTGGLNTIAIRMPSHKIALELIKKSGVFIAAPSANTSGKPSPTKASHVFDDLNGKIDVIIDGGEVGIGIESTIIDMTSEIPMILRPGYITKAMIEEVIGKVNVDKVVEAVKPNKSLIPKAPGMKYKHYAPKADLTLVQGDFNNVYKKINELVKNDIDNKKKVGIIATNESKAYYKDGIIKVIGSRENDETIAMHLYSILREFDDIEVDYIYSEVFYNSELGGAIMNRLVKASGYNILKV